MKESVRLCDILLAMVHSTTYKYACRVILRDGMRDLDIGMGGNDVLGMGEVQKCDWQSGTKIFPLCICPDTSSLRLPNKIYKRIRISLTYNAGCG
jgi:hypothetical protein